MLFELQLLFFVLEVTFLQICKFWSASFKEIPVKFSSNPLLRNINTHKENLLNLIPENQ